MSINYHKGGEILKGSEIKSRIIAAGLKVQEVANEYGITQTSFSRKLKHSFNDADTIKVLNIIERLKKA